MDAQAELKKIVDEMQACQKANDGRYCHCMENLVKAVTILAWLVNPAIKVK